MKLVFDILININRSQMNSGRNIETFQILITQALAHTGQPLFGWPTSNVERQDAWHITKQVALGKPSATRYESLSVPPFFLYVVKQWVGEPTRSQARRVAQPRLSKLARHGRKWAKSESATRGRSTPSGISSTFFRACWHTACTPACSHPYWMSSLALACTLS